MTRFQQEISGEIDKWVAEKNNTPNNHYWENEAREEVTKAIENARENAEFDLDGAIRWKESLNYLFADFTEKLVYGGYMTQMAAEITERKRAIQSANRLAEYREQMKNHKYTEEEVFEMRASFGDGEKIVNVFTGEEITL